MMNGGLLCLTFGASPAREGVLMGSHGISANFDQGAEDRANKGVCDDGNTSVHMYKRDSSQKFSATRNLNNCQPDEVFLTVSRNSAINSDNKESDE